MLGYIMGNITPNRSPLLRSAVKMKSTLKKSNANGGVGVNGLKIKLFLISDIHFENVQVLRSFLLKNKQHSER